MIAAGVKGFPLNRIDRDRSIEGFDLLHNIVGRIPGAGPEQMLDACSPGNRFPESITAEKLHL